MRLILTLTGGGAVPEKAKIKTLSTGSISIGRGAGNDWVLPDPDRSLSKTHCTITERNGRFILVDTSTNGIFINGAAQATERDSQTVLNQGDKLVLGDYTISVSSKDDGSLGAPDPDLGMGYQPVVPDSEGFSGVGGPAMPQGPLDVDPLDDPLGRPAHPGFQHPLAPVAVQPRGLDPFDQGHGRAASAGGIGPDDDLFRGIKPSNEWQGASRPDHTPVISQAVPTMRVASTPLSGDIDFDALIGDLPGSQGGFRAPPVAQDPFAAPPGTQGPVVNRSATPTNAADPFGGAQTPGYPQEVQGNGFQQPSTSGVSPGAPSGFPPNFNAADLLADLAPSDPSDPFGAPPALGNQPAQVPPVQPAAPQGGAQGVPQGVLPHPAGAQPAPMQAQPLTAAPVEDFAAPSSSAGSSSYPPAPQAPQPAARADAGNPFEEMGGAPQLHLADDAEFDPMAVTTRQAPAPAPATRATDQPTAMPPGAQPVAAALPSSASQAPAAADARALFRAFLQGAGIGDASVDDANPEAALRAAGEVFRAMAEGLREVLISRAAIKSEMRIEQTMIAAQGNNALKFSMTAEDAVIALLSPKRRGYMAPLAAAREAVSDIKDHEIAVMAGVQTALMTLLRRFDPDELEKRLSLGGLSAVLPGARKSRYWDSFRQIYGDITREAEDDFQSVFGRQFAKAYSQQSRKE